MRLLIEDLDEAAADDLALLLGVGDALQGAEELLPSIDPDDVQPQVLVVAQHALELALAQQAVVDEDTGEVLANGLVQEHGRHRGVDPAREREDDLVVAQLLSELGYGSLDEGGRRPVALDARELKEVAQQLCPLLGVEGLGVELYAPGLLAVDAEGGCGYILRAGDDAEALGQRRDGIAVRHPYGAAWGQVLQQRVVGMV